MSEYTMELNEVVDKLAELNTGIFDFNYELPEFMSKEVLESQFISHYYFREIGFETTPRFLQRFRTAWLEKLQEYDLKFKVVHDKLNSETALNTYEDNLKDTNTFNATPMSSVQQGKNYKTSITEVEGKHTGFNLYMGGGNVFKNINAMIGEHTEVINSFINEFDYLFMGVL